jgi:hypothetical protein
MDPDRIQPIEDYSPETLARLCDALDRSTTREHYVYREAELDDLWRVLDTALSGARRDSRKRGEAGRLERLLTVTMEAHDLVGSDERPAEAAVRLRAGFAPSGT